MVDTGAQKRTAAERSNPLSYSGILEHVLNYVGPWALALALYSEQLVERPLSEGR
jgi:hypothetical protein